MSFSTEMWLSYYYISLLQIFKGMPYDDLKHDEYDYEDRYWGILKIIFYLSFSFIEICWLAWVRSAIIFCGR